MSKKGLGKGLGALISTANEEIQSGGVIELKINEIEPTVGQPRKKFDDEKLMQLSESIKEHGIVQPIIVRKEDNTYKIVAGERRWRAARLAGLTSVPVIVKELSNRQVMEMALIENIQREDLNPIEEAEAYERLLNEYNMTQEELSKSIGKNRSTIANIIRLLYLCDKVKEHLINGEISSGHARAILALDDIELQEKVCKEIIEKSLSVRETEKLVKRIQKGGEKVEKVKNEDENIQKIEDDLEKILGTKVKLFNKNKKGKIMIEYYSNEDLERILELFKKMEK
ncbi:ParB/RepB/Spo0J family partition protein [Acetivibrio clariflavus]|uniref:ParB-like partition protein n=1 Tax=Acetivibrio clariflavus (strain DSM 19732 / NBRC 101661 / EBR45) TaxID=720554 RepID=G8LYQ0_ACECE|nr:ParB/RepB/Spo0J family partition protein [Acetivibrio clariflavus]AEV66768.1 ParB-like partition protein [Acetivibrio clariflavus DSM 19732]